MSRGSSGASAVELERQPSPREQNITTFVQQAPCNGHPVNSTHKRGLRLPVSHGRIHVTVLRLCKIGGVRYQRVESPFLQRLTDVTLNEQGPETRELTIQ